MSIAVLAGMQLFIPEEPIYDEAHYLRNTVHIASGKFQAFEFDAHYGPTGPGYAWLHAIVWKFAPQVTAIRIANVLLFLLSILLVSRTHEGRWDPKPALMMVCFPGIWVSASLGLTEMFSVFFLSLAVFFFRQKSLLPRWNVLLSAVMIGIAVYSRQTLIALSGVFFLLALQAFVERRKFDFPSALGGGLILLMALPLFMAWKGLLPADENPEIYARRGVISPENFTYAFVYALAFGLLAFKLPIARWWHNVSIRAMDVALVAGAALVAAAVTWSYELSYIPLKGTIVNALGEDTGHAIGQVFSWASIAMILLFLGAVARAGARIKDWARGVSRMDVFALSGIVLVVLTALAITHQFSSRYLVLSAPFFALLAQRWEIRWAPLMLLLALNFLSLYSYFS